MKQFAAALVVILLTGCSAPAPAGHDAEVPAEQASEQAAEHGDAAETPVVYPPGFPTAVVPMFEGTLLHVSHPGNIWAAWIESRDLVADLATASALLVHAGYTQVTTADGWAEFENTDRALRIVALDDPTYGASLAYTITDDATQSSEDAPTEESDH